MKGAVRSEHIFPYRGERCGASLSLDSPMVLSSSETPHRLPPPRIKNNLLVSPGFNDCPHSDLQRVCTSMEPAERLAKEIIEPLKCLRIHQTSVRLHSGINCPSFRKRLFATFDMRSHTKTFVHCNTSRTFVIG